MTGDTREAIPCEEKDRLNKEEKETKKEPLGYWTGWDNYDD